MSPKVDIFRFIFTKNGRLRTYKEAHKEEPKAKTARMSQPNKTFAVGWLGQTGQSLIGLVDERFSIMPLIMDSMFQNSIHWFRIYFSYSFLGIFWEKEKAFHALIKTQPSKTIETTSKTL